MFFPPSPTDTAAHEAAPDNRQLILVVEDDNSIRNTVVNMLTELGYRAIGATNGTEALALIDQNPDLDLLFTDMVLPAGLSGADIAVQARNRVPHIKILFTTGYSENHTDTSITVGGTDQILRKP